MIPHKILISLRFKTHELLHTGECLPPAIHDSGYTILEINCDSIEDAAKKRQEILEKVKSCIQC